jgi:hypothetical protein
VFFLYNEVGKRKGGARMNPDTLNNLLTISLMGQSIEEFNPKENQTISHNAMIDFQT